MNHLAIDYGLKRIGLAISINGIISPLPVIANDSDVFSKIKSIINDHQIAKIFIGLSQGPVATATQEFARQLSAHTPLPLEFVEEAVSTIEADEIYQQNKKPRKNYKSTIDSIAAAIILRRSLGS